MFCFHARVSTEKYAIKTKLGMKEETVCEHMSKLKCDMLFSVLQYWQGIALKPGVLVSLNIKKSDYSV